MSDPTKTRENVENPFNLKTGQHEGKPPVLNFACAPEDVAAAFQVAQRIARYVREVLGAGIVHPDLVHMDLLCLHCNGRPQDFRAWLAADVIAATHEYGVIANNIDRTCGKLPEFVRLRFGVS